MKQFIEIRDTNCPKCGGDRSDLCFFPRSLSEESETILWICQVCGYEQESHPKDYKPDV